MTPWLPRPLLRAHLPLLAVALSTGLVVSCVSVARTPGTGVLPQATPAPTTESDQAPVSRAGGAPTPMATAALPSPSPLSDRVTVATHGPSPTPRFAPTPLTDAPLVPTPQATASSTPGTASQVAASSAPPSSPGPAGPTLDEATRTRLAAILERTTGKGRVAGLQVAVRLADGRIYNYFEHPRYADIARAWLRPVSAAGLASREHAWTYDEIMSLVKTGYCRAGECYHYSNTNYVILGRIAEAVGGAPLHEQLRRRFFDPLGLTSTFYQPAEVPPPDAAHGHWDYGSGYADHTRDARVLPFEAALTVADAAGAIASTARDLSIWADALYGGAVLSPASLAEMTTMLEPGLYGLGTDVAVFAGRRAYGHRGGLRGFEASLWYFPDARVTIALLSNQGNWLTDVPMQKLASAVLGRAG